MTGNVHSLVRYEAACRALAEAKTVDEAKDIRDKAEAMRAYARQAKNKDLEVDAAYLRIRAERKLGELERAQADAGLLNKGGRPSTKTGSPTNPVSRAPTLKEAGIGKSLADRARKLAAVSEAEFEAAMADWRETVKRENERVTTNLLKIGNRRERDETKARPSITPAGKYGCIVIDPPWPMEKIERKVRPNQTGFDYPTLTEAEIAAFDVPGLAAGDCHMFCWTTQKFLPMALRLIEGWGFRYVLTMVWHKPGGFQPIGLPRR